MNPCIFLLLLLFAMGGALLTAQTASEPRSDLRGAVTSYIPAGTTNLSVAQVISGRGSAFLVAAWSSPSGRGRNASVIVVEQAEKARNVIGRFSVEYGYSPSVVVKPEFRFRGTPVALVETQFGAAASGLLVVGVGEGRAYDLGSIDADYFDFIGLGGVTLLVAHEDVNVLDVPHLYQWTGKSFADDSMNHPEFYKGLVAKLRRERDFSQFAPAVRQNFAKLVKLSGGAEASNK